ncbi:MAG: tetratricopeptide repeat-containing glycosyltransferase family 2 protein [Cellulosilyticaceae bacterium]
MTISLCMIVKDEEKSLEICLESVKDIVEEIIIVDTGSSDHTMEIAKKFTDKVYTIPWEDDFAKARNISFDYATQDYILWLDADDLIEKEEQSKIKALKTIIDTKIDVVLMKYYTEFDSKGDVILSYYRERLVKRSKGFRWVEPVHELLQIDGNMMYSDIYIVHRGKHTMRDKTINKDRNLRIYETILEEGGILSTRGKLYYARELYDHGFYREAKEHFLKFIQEEEDREGCANACFMIGQCNKMLGEEEVAILYKSFKYTEPRKEVCCEIAAYYLGYKAYKKAIFWYEMALQLPTNSYSFKAQYHEYEGYIPHMGLYHIYNAMGDVALAKYHKEEAKKKQDLPVMHKGEFYSARKGGNMNGIKYFGNYDI